MASNQTVGEGRDSRVVIIVVSGVAYQKYGSITVSTGSYTAMGDGKQGLWYASKYFEAPYTPPAGWAFKYTVREAVGNMFQQSINTQVLATWVFVWSAPSPQNVVIAYELTKK